METEAIRSRGRAWTTEDRKELREMAEAGLCATAIADRLGRTQAAVRGEAWRQEPPLRLAPDVGRWTQDEKDKLRDLARGTTYGEAAKTMGRSVVAVRSQAREMKLLWEHTQDVGRRYSQLEDSKIMRAVERNEPLWTVTIDLGGRSEKSVRRRLDRLRRRLRRYQLQRAS